MNKKLTIINIALVLLAIFLAYMVIDSIRQPVVFENSKRDREEKVVQNLKDIRPDNLILQSSNDFMSDKTYPSCLVYFKTEHKNRLHPTQKPIALLEYLIKTYSNENEVVLDNCMGSGSSGIACLNTNRKFIGIELDDKYFETAKNRIENHKNIK